MMNYFTDAALEFEAQPLDTILLEDTQIEQAINLSHAIQNENQQWQTYLNALALFAFEEWLLERAPELPIDKQECSIFKLPYANVISAVCNLKVGEFKICLMAIGSLTERTIAFPRATIELPQFIPHFYVVLTVTEELEQATIQGFVRYDQLMERLNLCQLKAETNWNYRLPLAWFENNLDELLHCLRFVKPADISLPKVANCVSIKPSKIEELLPQMQSSEGQLWQVLNWQQGAAVLSNYDLLNRLLDIHQKPEESSSKELTNAENRLQIIKEPIVNVGLWLRDEIDDFAKKLSWVLLPAFAPEAVPLRSPTQELEVILKQLERNGTKISPVARGAYQDFKLAENSLRLYAVTWSRFLPENIPAWTLLLILGTTPGTSLSGCVKLILSDEAGVLLEKILAPHADETYLYAQTVGTWDEEFSVTLTTQQGTSLTLPPFVFRPN
jgi:hypothetical protein